MSGSYLALKSQINQILALTIANSSQTLAQVLANGNDADGSAITGLSSLESSGTLNLKSSELQINDSAGLATNVLTSQGPGLPAIWATGGVSDIQAVLEKGNESSLPLLIVSDEDNYTELMHDPATLVGLTVKSEFFGTKTATLASNALTITDVQAPNTTTAELGYRLDLNLVNGAAETQRCFYDTNSINFLSNVGGGDVNTLYTATGMTSNQNCVLDAPLLTIPGQASFSTPPHSVEAVNGNDLATKGYVDSLVGQYSGGYNLFFNYSVDDGIYKSLGGSVVAAAQQSVLITTDGTEQVVASFVSGELGVTALPAGIWNALIYGQVNNAGGILTYFFDLLKLTGSTETLIVRSANSSDINSAAPAAYTANAALTTEYPLELTDKIVIRIYVHHDGADKDVTTYFQDVYYSFSQSTLNAGTTLLSSNNTWTGLNHFVLPPTTPTNPTPASDAIINKGDISSLITAATPGLGAVLGVSSDASGSNVTNVGALSVNSAIYAYPGEGAPNSQFLYNGLDFRPAAGTYPTTHMDINYLSIETAAENNARLSNFDQPRLALNTPTRGLELTNSSLYVGGGFGSSGQVLTRTAVDNEFKWAAIPAPPTPDPIVSNIQYFLTTASPFFQYPPAQPSAALIASSQYYGWYFKNAVALRKIDWFFAPNYGMVVSDVLGLYMNYFNIAATSNDNLPFISIYTKPTGSGDVIPGFAHSVCTYIADFTPTVNTPYCSFMNISGTQPDPFAYGHQLGAMILSPVAPNPRGEYLPTEEVLAIAVGTNSAATVDAIEFTMGKVGVCLAQGNQENILVPQYIAPTLSQVLASDSAAGSQPISGVTTLTATTLSAPTLDASAALNVGASTALGVNVGRSGQTTDLVGNVRVNGSSGTSGQVLTSTGASTAPTWQAAGASSWVGTATSELQMGTYPITSSTSLVLGDPLNNVNIRGIVLVPLSLTVGTTPEQVLIFGGEEGNLYDTTTQNNIELRINASGGLREQTYNAIISPTASGTGALILPLVKKRYYVNVFNGSTHNWTIASQTGELIAGGLAGGGITSASSVTIKPAQSMVFSQIDGGVLGKFNVFMSEVLQGTSPVFSGATIPTIDTAATLNLGASTATGVNVGRSGQTTNLVGNVRVNGSGGTAGEVLTSTGASTAPVWQTPPSGWVGTAASQLNMGIYDISGAVVDNSGNTLTLGANTTTTTIGKATTGITNLRGIVQVSGAAGTSGQVLTSAGPSAVPTWTTPSGGTPSLTYVKTNPVLNAAAFGGAGRFTYQNNFLNITPPTLTATYLIKSQLTVNLNGANTNFFGNLGIQSGGGVQTTAAISAFNGLAMSNAANTTFGQTNSLTQCTVNTTTVFGQLSFTYIHTPATLSTLSYSFWLGTSAAGAGTIFSMEIIQITA